MYGINLSKSAQSALAALVILGIPATASAQEAINGADTVWVMVASALVLFMMIPGLAMFYAGLVRTKNVLSLFMQCFAITAVVTLLWVVYGYTVAFSAHGMVEGAHNVNTFVGSLDKLFLCGITPETARQGLPEAAFVIFQMTFAIITPGLFIGAFAERMKFSAVVLFTIIWVTFGYLPVCHMVWGGKGALFADMGVIDFAGGIVVHITAGVTALIAAIMVGPRKGYRVVPMPPHNLVMTLSGTAMLWVGWFGFNGGSALVAGGQAAMAIVVTQISPCVAGLTWVVIERVKVGKPSALGFATGAIAGLAAITPASGSVGPTGAMAIGLTSGLFCYWAATSLKTKFGYDDALDVVGVHGGGGIVGTILVAVFGAPALGGWVKDMHIASQLGVQLFAIAVTVLLCGTVAVIGLKIVDKFVGLRIDSENEEGGLDLAEHGEVGYDF